MTAPEFTTPPSPRMLLLVVWRLRRPEPPQLTFSWPLPSPGPQPAPQPAAHLAVDVRRPRQRHEAEEGVHRGQTVRLGGGRRREGGGALHWWEGGCTHEPQRMGKQIEAMETGQRSASSGREVHVPHACI